MNKTFSVAVLSFFAGLGLLLMSYIAMVMCVSAFNLDARNASDMDRMLRVGFGTYAILFFAIRWYILQHRIGRGRRWYGRGEFAAFIGLLILLSQTMGYFESLVPIMAILETLAALSVYQLQVVLYRQSCSRKSA